MPPVSCRNRDDTKLSASLTKFGFGERPRSRRMVSTARRRQSATPFQVRRSLKVPIDFFPSALHRSRCSAPHRSQLYRLRRPHRTRCKCRVPAALKVAGQIRTTARRTHYRNQPVTARERGDPELWTAPKKELNKFVLADLITEMQGKERPVEFLQRQDLSMLDSFEVDQVTRLAIERNSTPWKEV